MSEITSRETAQTPNMNLEPYSQIEELKRRHEGLFQLGFGCYRIDRLELNLKPDARPVFRSKRPVLYTTQSLLKSELNSLQSEGNIERVHKSE
ncbi:unnamed protein product [Dicrocoelium dendriticum]|nr:unnamed protein product [Dicrocoelium dendriticum]